MQVKAASKVSGINGCQVPTQQLAVAAGDVSAEELWLLLGGGGIASGCSASCNTQAVVPKLSCTLQTQHSSSTASAG
jgi:hypothetical protein